MQKILEIQRFAPLRQGAKKFALVLRTAALLLVGAGAAAQAAGGSGALPAELAQALERARVAQDDVAFWVAPAGSGRPVLALNADRAVQPASTVKLVTTLAALDLLGPAYTWKTRWSARAMPDAAGLVRGLTIEGGGDPWYVIERLWLAAQRLSALGVRTIEGDIAVDRSLFDLAAYTQGEFDGQRTRPYNVGPDAAMVSFKSVSLDITPVKGQASARVTALPQLSGLRFPQTVRTVAGPCGDWRSRLKMDVSNPRSIRFSGVYPEACGQKSLHLSLWSADEYFTRALAHVLSQSGIAWKGRVRDAGPRGAAARSGAGVLLYEDVSAPLVQSVYWTNKFSNNPMARQLFLSLSLPDGAEGAQGAASLEKSRRVLQEWLTRRVGVRPGEIVVDNGSGLSRTARVTARAMGELLSYGFRSAVMPEFMASLPVTGVDGTMKRRPLEGGVGHIKTGLLSNVRSAAGYVADNAGRRWSVVAVINADPMPAGAQRATQALLQWCASGGARRAFEQSLSGGNGGAGAK